MIIVNEHRNTCTAREIACKTHVWHVASSAQGKAKA